MFYLIDFDKREAVAKSDKISMFEDYIHSNDLGMALVIISSEDELVMELSIVEMQSMYDGISDHPRTFVDDDEAASITWSTLQSVEETIPKFTPALGKRLIKQAGSDSSSATDQSKKATPTKHTSPKEKAADGVAKRRKSKFLNAVFEVGAVEPLKGRHTQMVNLVEDNMGEATYAELCELLSNHKGRPDEHIGFAVRKGFLCIAEDL